MFGFVYVTTNKVNGKKYVGMCKYGKPGWETYLGSGKRIIAAIKKYGEENFSREVICEAASREELVQKEIDLIAEYGAVDNPNWYNIATGGFATNGFAGKKHTSERNAKIAESLRGRKRPQHVIDALVKYHTGLKRPKEWRAKQAATLSANHPRSIPVTLNGVTYRSITEASAATGMYYAKIKRLIA